MSTMVGIAFQVIDPDLHFPRNFTIIAESSMCLQLRNNVETYWVSRTRFTAALGERFVQAKQGSR